MSINSKNKPTLSVEEKQKVLIVGMQLPGDTTGEVENSLEELSRLIDTLGAEVVHSVIQKKDKPHPAMFVGTGKAEEIAALAKEHGCSLVAFDNELTGTQQKNLENTCDCKVIDRTGIILEIFSKHARTKEAKNQVELASLEYLSTHLSRRWTHLERQKGGIGLKGAGERQIEIDRRLIRTRISRLKETISHTIANRQVQRAHRGDNFLRVAIVGYTNAGKSTLMNNLTMSQVYVDDRLFATLDSTVKVIDPKTRPPVLLSDTVGFIDKLPHSLVASFRSTLAEVLEADLLLHLVDISSEQYPHHLEVTRQVLEDIGAGSKPSMLIFNKADLLEEVFLPKILERKYIDSLVVSSFNPEDMVRLRNAIFGYFERDMMELEIIVSYENSWLQSQIHEYSKVLEKEYLEEGTKFKIRIMKATAGWLKLIKEVDTP